MDLLSRDSDRASTRTVRAAALTGYVELARSLGLSPTRMAADVGIPAAALGDPDARIPALAVARLLERSARAGGADDFGLRLAEGRRLSNLGPVGLIMRDQSSLRGVLEMLRRYQWLHNESLIFSLAEDGDLALLRLEAATAGAPASRQAVELSLGVLAGNLRALMAPGWNPLAMMVRHAAPADTRRHQRLFGGDLLFRQDLDALVLARADLDAPLASADPAMAGQVERFVQRLAAERPRRLREQVDEIIALLLPEGGCTADRVAARLGFDRRTLHRRLAAEGCTFEALADERRRALVLRLIGDGRSLTEVADLAGFAAPSGLTHWFRRRFGVSPRAWRRGIPGGG